MKNILASLILIAFVAYGATSVAMAEAEGGCGCAPCQCAPCNCG